MVLEVDPGQIEQEERTQNQAHEVEVQPPGRRQLHVIVIVTTWPSHLRIDHHVHDGAKHEGERVIADDLRHRPLVARLSDEVQHRAEDDQVRVHGPVLGETQKAITFLVHHFVVDEPSLEVREDALDHNESNGEDENSDFHVPSLGICVKKFGV